MSQEREDYKERLREAGRRRLEEFRRLKGAAANRAAGVSGSGPGAAPSTVELTTFCVVTRPAAVDEGKAAPDDTNELRLLRPALASTSLGVLPPGCDCLPQSPPHVPAAVAAASSSPGSANPSGVSSVAASPAKGTQTATTSTTFGPGSSPPYSSPARRPHAPMVGGMAVGGEEDGEGASSGVDSATVDMLLVQVEALMRDKAALAAENVALRQQVEQLTELVGWLSLERGEGEVGEGTGAEEELGEGLLGSVGSGEQEEEMAHGELAGLGPLRGQASGLTGLGSWGEGRPSGGCMGVVAGPVFGVGVGREGGQDEGGSGGTEWGSGVGGPRDLERVGSGTVGRTASSVLEFDREVDGAEDACSSGLGFGQWHGEPWGPGAGETGRAGSATGGCTGDSRYVGGHPAYAVAVVATVQSPHGRVEKIGQFLDSGE